MLVLKLTREELKALGAFFSDERKIKPLYSNFGAWFPKQMDSFILKIKALSKKAKSNHSWPMSFGNRMSFEKKGDKNND